MGAEAAGSGEIRRPRRITRGGDGADAELGAEGVR